MPGVVRFFLLIFVLTITFIGATAVTVSHRIGRSGFATISITDHTTSHRLRLSVPAGLINVAAAAPGRVHVGDEAREILLQLADELEASPDASLLRVEGGRGETVLIQKEADRYVISVDSAEASVRITLPPRTFEKILRSFARTGRHRLSIVVHQI
jgi:hypothetical protein